jgi:two-component system KDP operon response regulator KdpE
MDDELLLVVDDEPAIVRALTTALTARGYRVESAESGEQAIEQVAVLSPAVVILDLALPDIDGVEVCRRVRGWSGVPIIVLTAEGSDDRKVLALEEGADDYVTKPFSMSELVARVRVALRHRRASAAAGSADEAALRVGDIVIDQARREVTVDGALVDLTPKEYGFLVMLARHPGRVLTHRAILQEVWGPAYGTESQYLRVYASQLRKKLRDDPKSPRIVSEAGVGYRLVDREMSS